MPLLKEKSSSLTYAAYSESKEDSPAFHKIESGLLKIKNNNEEI